MDWGKCLVCQRDTDFSLHSVQFFNTSNSIKELATYDQELMVALAGVSDLKAAEGKYHLKCYTKYKRDAADVKRNAGKSDLPMAWLCSYLQNSASKGHIYVLNDMWLYYTELCAETQIDVPQSFGSRRASFKEKLEQLVKSDTILMFLKDVVTRKKVQSWYQRSFHIFQ